MTKVLTAALETGLTLSYAAQGDLSGRVVVLLLGPTDSWLSYEPVLEQLPPSIRAVALSLRGHGESDKPATGYRVEDSADDVVSLLDALAVESPCWRDTPARASSLAESPSIGRSGSRVWCSKRHRRPFAATPG